MPEPVWHLLAGGHQAVPLAPDDVRTKVRDRRVVRIVSAASRTGRSEGAVLDAAGIGRIFTGG